MSVSTRSLLSKLKCVTFAVTYAPEYKYLTASRIIADRHHPLHAQAVRAHGEKERAGLWWMISVNSISSKKSVVRNWLKRRLRQAFVEELKSRGYDRDGNAITKGKHAAEEIGQEMIIAQRPRVLTGSLRLSVQPSLLTTKFVDVKREAGSVVDSLIQTENRRQETAQKDIATGRAQMAKRNAKPASKRVEASSRTQIPKRNTKPTSKQDVSKSLRFLSSKKASPKLKDSQATA